MKKIYALLIQANIVVRVLAQPPVLTDENFSPLISQKVDKYFFDTTGFSPGLSGPMVTWNYGMLNGKGYFNIEVLPSASTPHAPSFTASNIAVTVSALNYDYYLTHTSGIDYYGNGNSTQVSPLSDPARLYDFPFTYASILDDSLHGSFTTNGYPTERKGRVMTEGDGYGTLTTPAGTYTDVLRVKSEWTYRDVILTDTATVILDYDQVHYYWVTPGIHFPLMVYVKTTHSGSGPVATTAEGYYLDPWSITGISDAQNITADGFDIYPNPLTGEWVGVRFNAVHPGDANLTVFNADGRQVLTSTVYANKGPNLLTLDARHLQPGVYLLEMSHASGRFVRRLVVH